MPSSSLANVAINWLGQIASAATPERRRELYTFAIEGGLTAEVYAQLDRASRRSTGVFFSGRDWASALVKKIPSGKWRRYIDPSAGTGDLLIEIATHFRKKEDLGSTLENWSSRLVAIDLELEFLRIFWLRLVSLALIKHRMLHEPDMALFSPPESIKSGDFLDIDFDFKRGDCLVTNPPYQRIIKEGQGNGSGMRSAAAFHLEKVTRSSCKGVGLVALVPDVLRCGRNYQKFRSHLRQSMSTLEIEPQGQFSCGVDVDVAIISGLIGKGGGERPVEAVANGTFERVADLYKVSVGSVVPHRDVEDGALLPYIVARSLQRWGVLTDAVHWAAYSSKKVSGPFVVIRRTSSPSDKKRAVATVIDVNCPVLVENHLIVVQPLNGGLQECIDLVCSLEDPRTDMWLNEQMRCRHLTVGAIKELPFHRTGG